MIGGIMSKTQKIVIITVAVALVVAVVAFCIFYFLGLTGIHHHSEPKEGQIKVACVGDSITYGHGISDWEKNNYPAQLQGILGDDYHVANFGHSARTLSPDGDRPYIESEQYRLSLEYDADIVVIMLGTNDSKPANWVDEEDFIKKYDDFINSYKENNPNVKIILCTPAKCYLPIKDNYGDLDIRSEVVDVIKDATYTYATTKGYNLVNIYALTDNHEEWFGDKIHPSKDGAKVMAEAIADMVRIVANT